MSEKSLPPIRPVILCGGSGSRLWPVSRSLYPKQFQRFATRRTLFQQTVARVQSKLFQNPIVVCNDDHRFIAAEQLREIGVTDSLILIEPLSRMTAMAVALAVALAEADDPDTILAVMPSDHLIHAPPENFADIITRAATRVDDFSVTTLVSRTVDPSVTVGLAELGNTCDGTANLYEIKSFIAHPDAQQVEKAAGESGWAINTGIFVTRTSLLTQLLDELEPGIMSAARSSVREARADLDFLRAAAEPIEDAKSIDFETAVLERTDRAGAFDTDLLWLDVTNWESVWNFSLRDDVGNVMQGNVEASNTQNSLVISDDKLTVVNGLENIAVVVTEDSVLVSDINDTNAVGDIVSRLSEKGCEETVSHPTVYRPWGSYHSLALGERYQVKEIVVVPGASLSLQKHFHRAEHWVVVQGTAKVHCDGREFLVHENESTFIPLGSVHRLTNPGEVDIRLIEIQSGDYLGEDDIVRLEDTYGRLNDTKQDGKDD